MNELESLKIRTDILYNIIHSSNEYNHDPVYECRQNTIRKAAEERYIQLRGELNELRERLQV